MSSEQEVKEQNVYMKVLTYPLLRCISGIIPFQTTRRNALLRFIPLIRHRGASLVESSSRLLRAMQRLRVPLELP